MTWCISGVRCSALLLALWASSAQAQAQAQAESSRTLKEVVVTATRVEQPLADLLADVSIIDRDAIERSGAASLPDVLRGLPGVEMVRNGGAGASTSVYLRGAESRFTAVYVNGVRMDSQATGGVSWEAIPLAQIERVEVLRGPAAAVYGSDALGGVIQIFTRKGDGVFSPSVSLGVGNYGTSKLDVALSGGEGHWDYALALGTESSKGFNARVQAGQNPDDDGYKSDSASLRLGAALVAGHRLEASFLGNDQNSQYDSTGVADNRNLRQVQATGLSWSGAWSDAYRTTVSVNESVERYETLPSPYVTKTLLRGYLLQNEWRAGTHLLTATLERREDLLNNASTTPRDTSRFQNALALGYGLAGEVHSVQANIRRDQDSEFGQQATGSLAYGYAITPQWRATLASSTAFRAPTLYQRFSVYGTADLQPETSRNQELALRYRQGPAQFAATVYFNEVSNLISYTARTGSCINNRPPVALSSRGCYLNTARARYRGVTLSAQSMVADVHWHASLDLQDPRDGVTGDLLARRATHHAVLGGSTRWGVWSMGAQALLSSARYDKVPNATVLPAYAVLNVSATRPLSPQWSVLVRVDNATDASYQLAETYAAAGRTLYVGLKWAP
ncbi:MAG: TonB-dependent receptor [Curvibacter sp. RIFCSPHIGHO2_12_FULL_63_18]|nr:TonB-dependent receptor [Rhodoferax sp.]OGO97007.1 MAG: TonB-dependent receptor [Curvibacter sp. GWA2_63_95]OGP01184.1 MAG: TonB-dependent receptor [Curvibacter sp. RIFCSPHIGHO2_12_FULL_63_18]HCX80001.1 TonB-dependent receptor [Rhodoferax sp.]